jgi:ubiquinol-cytochrome c reductase iron-sulfur subunit
MNEQDHTSTEVDAVASDGDSGALDRFTDPGLPPHTARMADASEAGARRAERQVAALFSVSILGTLIFLVAYFAVPMDATFFLPGVGEANTTHVVLGVGLALALLGIGLGAVHWAKTLMPDTEVVEMRHPMRSSDADREDAAQTFLAGGAASQITRRPLIKYTLGGSLGLFSLPLLVQLVGSLGPLPQKALSLTYWNGGPSGPGDNPTFKPLRLMRDPENTPIKASDVTLGSVFHVLPEGLLDLQHGVLEEKAKAAVLLMRLDPKDIKSQKERNWSYEGIVAYSKICTHVGCPVGLYEHTTHHLLCPCHQSTFDVTDDCRVIFGPARRPLPQLKITVDDEGYLVSAQPFREAVGPSFWERG